MAKKSFSTSIKCLSYSEFVKNLTDDQKAAVRSCGFGSLLHFNCSEAPRTIGYMLARRFDVPTRTVRMDNGSSFDLNAFVTHQILGVPLGGWKVRESASSSEKEIIAADTGTATVAPTIADLFNLVTPGLTGDKFVRLFMLISLSTFLCPTSYPRASKKYYSAVASVTDIPKYDWSSFILDWLVEGIDDFQKSVAADKQMSTLCGCIIVLVFAYFEYIKAPGIILREDLPRIKIWNDRMISEYLELEGNSPDDTFGRLELKDPTETPFVSTSVASSSFATLPAHVESFIQNLAPHNDLNPTGQSDQSNVRSQIRDLCRNFHKDIMSAALSAIQPVVSRQMCSIAEMLWNNHGGAATFGPARGSDNDQGTSDAATPVQVDSVVPEVVISNRRRQTDTRPVQMDMEAPQGRTTRSRSKAMNSPTYVDMSSASSKGKKQLHKGMSSARRMTPITANNTSKGTKSRSASEQVPDSYEIPVQTSRDTRNNTKKYVQCNNEATEKEMDKELDTGQDKIVVQSSENVIEPSLSTPTDLSAGTGSVNAGGGHTPVGQPSVSIPKDVNDDVDIGNVIPEDVNDDVDIGNVIPEVVFDDVNDVEQDVHNVIVDKQAGQHGTDTECQTIHSDYTPVGTINCAQPFSYTTPNSESVPSSDRQLSMFVERSHINSDVKWKDQSGSSVQVPVITSNFLREDVPFSFEFRKAVPKTRKREIGAIINLGKVIDVESGSDSSNAHKKERLNEKDLDYSDKLSASKDQVDDVTPEIDPTRVQSISDPTGDRSTIFEEVVPDSFEGLGSVLKRGLKRRFAVIRTIENEIDIGSDLDSSEPNKKQRVIRCKQLVDSKKITTVYATVFDKSCTSQTADPIVYGGGSQSSKAVNIEPVDNSPRNEEAEDATPEAQASSVQIMHTRAARTSSKQFQRKRAQKPSIRLFTQSFFFKNPQEKIQVSKNEVYLYDRATGRIPKKEEGNIVAEIGRFYVTAKDLADCLGPRDWVGTFVMNVYCEAMNADNLLRPHQETSKCFLTSEIVERLNKVNFDCSRLSSYVSNKCCFSMDDFDMVMMPVCNVKHWWLIVADLRDHRFDILNSEKLNAETSEITERICNNFRELYQSMFERPNLDDFQIYEQPTPKQSNNFDCGIYVMKFMEVWCGRKVYPLDGKHISKYRQLIVNYILRHRDNRRTTDYIQKAIEFKYPEKSRNPANKKNR